MILSSHSNLTPFSNLIGFEKRTTFFCWLSDLETPDEVIDSLYSLHLAQLFPSIEFRGELLNPFRKRWSFALTQHEKRNEAPKLYEVGVESPAIWIAAEDEGG